jgi:hypothetical protein
VNGADLVRTRQTEPAPGAVFLLSGQASYITGQLVDGGIATLITFPRDSR